MNFFNLLRIFIKNNFFFFLILMFLSVLNCHEDISQNNKLLFSELYNESLYENYFGKQINPMPMETCPYHPHCISVDDNGAIPNDGKDDYDAIQSVINSCYDNYPDGCDVVFTAGATYTLSSPASQNTIVLWGSNLTLVGNGATLVHQGTSGYYNDALDVYGLIEGSRYPQRANPDGGEYHKTCVNVDRWDESGIWCGEKIPAKNNTVKDLTIRHDVWIDKMNTYGITNAENTTFENLTSVNAPQTAFALVATVNKPKVDNVIIGTYPSNVIGASLIRTHAKNSFNHAYRVTLEEGADNVINNIILNGCTSEGIYMAENGYPTDNDDKYLNGHKLHVWYRGYSPNTSLEINECTFDDSGVIMSTQGAHNLKIVKSEIPGGVVLYSSYKDRPPDNLELIGNHFSTKSYQGASVYLNGINGATIQNNFFDQFPDRIPVGCSSITDEPNTYGYVFSRIMTGDFNHDGKIDYVYFDKSGKFYVRLSNGTDGFKPYQLWGSNGTDLEMQEYKIGDFNGDGRDDIISFESDGEFRVWLTYETSTGFKRYQWWGRNDDPIGADHYKIGDFDGNGKDDVALIKSDGNFYIWLANDAGTGFLSPQWWGKNGGGVGMERYKIGDFNGDSKDDIASCEEGYFFVWTANDTGTSFNSFQYWGGNGVDSGGERYMIGDFNGDGKADVASFESTGYFNVWLAYITDTGDIRFPQNPYAWGWNGGDMPTRYKIGDFNGDGMDDVMSFESNGGIYLWKSASTSFYYYVGLGNYLPLKM